jgi:hypothetical protein
MGRQTVSGTAVIHTDTTGLYTVNQGHQTIHFVILFYQAKLAETLWNVINTTATGTPCPLEGTKAPTHHHRWLNVKSTQQAAFLLNTVLILTV